MKHASPKNTGSKEPKIEVTSHDFIKHDRNQFWYIGIGLLILGSIYLAVYLKDYLSAVVALVVGITVFRLAQVEPTAKKFSITEQGIYWGNEFLAYHQLRAFWLNNVDGKTFIYIERASLHGLITLTTSQQDAEKIVKQLSEYLPLHDHRGEPLPDKIARFFKL